MAKFGVSSVLTAFAASTIGTKVRDFKEFCSRVEKYVDNYDFTACRIPGQGFIIMPPLEFYDLITAGDGPATDEPTDYTVCKHRGEIGCYLRREKAGDLKFVALVIFTKAAYNADPDVIAEGRYTEDDYMFVAVIGSSGPAAPRTPGRFVHNLAGGNRETLDKTAGELQKEAKEIVDYWSKWSVVAD